MSPKTGNIRILFAEDLPADVELAKREIKKEKIAYTYKVVDNEDTFRQEIESFHPDIVISDYAMPRFDGMLALKITQSIDASIPFIILTGSMNEETAVKCMKAGATDYVLKERIKRLPFAVLEALGKKKIRDENEQFIKQLKENEEKFRSVFESANAGKSITQFSGELSVNKAFCEMLGYKPEEMKNKKWQEITPPEDVDSIHAIIDPLLKGEKNSARFEKRYLHKNGSIIWGDVNAVIQKDKNGKPLYFITTVVDITERKINEDRLALATEALRESERFSRATLDALSANLCVTDESGNILSVNKAWRDFSNANNGIPELLSEKANYFKACESAKGNDKEEADRFTEGMRQVISGLRNEFVMEYACHSPDEQRWFNGRVTRFMSNGRLSLVIAHENITERRQAEEALRKSEEQYRLIVENANDGIEITQNNHIIFSNSRFAEMLGYTQNEILQIPFNHIFSESGIQDLYARQKERQIAGKVSSTYLTQFRKKDGTLIDVEVNYEIIDFNGEPATFAIIRDVTENLKLQAQFQQAQKMESVGRLAGGVAHDFNNMLGVILGYTELALNRVESGNPLRSELSHINEAARRSAQITQQLLAFARKQIISPKVLDLNTTVETMLKMLRRLIGEDIDLAWLPSKGLWPILADSSQIDQILANLCVNARDAIEGVGKVTIETGMVGFDEDYCNNHPGFHRGDFVLMSVSDNGCGMDKETISRLFEPFFTTKPAGKGTGLGLATVYGIVKQNNGFINVYSEPGRGTSFKIYLPRYIGQAEMLDEEADTKVPIGKGETILIVEDEMSMLRLSEKILTELGYTVLVANSPGEAIEIAGNDQNRIDLLLTDVVMPGMTGREMKERIQKLVPAIKTIYMSGYTANVIAHQGILHKDVNFIQKPFSVKDIAILLHETLNKT